MLLHMLLITIFSYKSLLANFASKWFLFFVQMRLHMFSYGSSSVLFAANFALNETVSVLNMVIAIAFQGKEFQADFTLKGF